MLDLKDINTTIEKLENGSTTFDTCVKLASLYIVRDYMTDAVENEVVDVSEENASILPRYEKYNDIKNLYHVNQTTAEAVKVGIADACKEISALVQTMYNNSDLPEERSQIRSMIEELKTFCQ